MGNIINIATGVGCCVRK